mmetsp:Transcript_48400/g.113271  ORF Transcript_48400/g.113271 Transcript_48400/m.113271 type:complete len:629 (+) Transcript_48400:30-1916(+)
MGIKAKVICALIGFLAVCALTAYIVGIAVLLLVLTLSLFLLHLNSGKVLAWLVCWAIAQTPKKFRWTIRRVFLRARLEREDSDWSMIIMEGWTWHNPPGFSDESESYILECDRFVAYLKLSSIYDAVTKHGSIAIDMLELHGFRFNAQANERGTINLWKAIDLPDDDVNVIMQTVADQTQPIGRHHAVMKNIKALPPVSSASTRKATGFWREEWGARNHESLKEKKLLSKDTVKSSVKKKAHTLHGEATKSTPLLAGYFEYPIGDPRRRPRWGVPVRFDIRRLFLADVELWVLDLLIKEPTTNEERKLNKITLEKISLSREQLEAGDRRKSGGGDEWHEGDGVHGIYLGELVWALVTRVVPKVAFSSPSRALKDAMSACGFCMSHLMQKVEAKSIQRFLAIAGKGLGAGFADMARRKGPGAKLKVHLQAGREITVDDYKAANSFIQMRLWNAVEGEFAGSPECEAHSHLRVWTKEPQWDEHFELGPVRFVQSTLQVLCYHCRKTEVMKHPVHMAPQARKLIGQVTIPIGQLLLEDASIGADRLIVGWFPLEMDDGKNNGEIKVGLQVVNAAQLVGLEAAYQPAKTNRMPGSEKQERPGQLAGDAEIDSSSWGCAMCVPQAGENEPLDP